MASAALTVYDYYTPTPTPTPSPYLTVYKDVRNISSGTGESNSVYAKPNDTLEFSIRIYTNNYYAYGIRASDYLPSGLRYVSGSTTVDGNYVSDGLTSGNLYIGGRSANTSIQIRFKAQIENESFFSYGTTNIINTVNVNADNAPGISDSATVFVERNQISAGQLNIQKFEKNISKGDTIEKSNVNVSRGDTMEFILRVRSASSLAANNVIVRDVMPAGLSYVNNSTSLNGNIIQDGIINSGVNIGYLSPNQEAVLKFKAVINSSASGTMINYAYASADNIVSVRSPDAAMTVGIVAGALDIKTGSSAWTFYLPLLTASLASFGYFQRLRIKRLLAGIIPVV